MCMAAFEKKQPFLFIVFGTSKHNIEVGGYGGNVCIYGVSCGWLFFLKNPGRVFFVSSLVQHTHTDTLCICVSMLKKTGNRKNSPRLFEKSTRTAFTPLFASQLPVLFVRGHGLTFCISRTRGPYFSRTNWRLETKKFFPDSFTPLFASQLPVLFVRADIDWHYAFPGALKHIARTELIQKLLQIWRFSASKISPLPPKILVPATLVPLPQFRDVICVALLMQRTCNTHATHMQHTCNTTCNTSIFPVNLQSTCRIWRFQLNPSLRMENVDFHPRGHFSWKFPRKRLVLHVVLHVCCMCVACVLHVRCMSRAAGPHKSHPWTGEVGQAWQAQEFWVAGARFWKLRTLNLQ